MSDLISVCLATCNRPVLLMNTLESLSNQKTDDLFTYEVIVVDNGVVLSEYVVNKFKNKINIKYYVQPIKNISLTRNMCVEKAKGIYFAFIDDDEHAENTWLLELYKAIKVTKGDAVFGPVIQLCPKNSPSWCKQFFKTDLVENYSLRKEGHTGNALVKKECFLNNSFNSSLGLTGGEDTDFFNKIQKNGGLLFWASFARVYETVELKRLTLKWILLRSLRCSQRCSTDRMVNKNIFVKTLYYLLKIIQLIIFSFFLLPSFLFGLNVAVKTLRIFFCQIGHVSSFFSNLKYEEYK